MPFGLLEISFQLQDHFYLYLGATVLQAGATIKLTILEYKQKANQQNLQPYHGSQCYSPNQSRPYSINQLI